MIEREDRDGVTVLRLDHGKVNALDLELLEAITATFTSLATDGAPPVVLTGAGSAFSAGVDLRRIVDGGADYVRRFLPALSQAFETTFTYPGPLVAAVNGHAIAGGFILVCAADRRFGADGGARLGITELKVGVPFPAAAMEVVRFAVGDPVAQRLAMTGDLLDTAGAATQGILDAVVAPDELATRAVDEARRLGAIPTTTFRLTKQQLRRPTVGRIAADRQAHDPQVLEQWAADETVAAIEAFMAATLSRS